MYSKIDIFEGNRKMRKIRISVSFTVILCLTNLFVLSLSSGISNLSSDENTYFPDDEWRKSSPEEQNMSSNKLTNWYQTLTLQRTGMDSVHIIRNGYLVYEKYFEYYNHSNLHQMWSTTKSITSILIGIANASGFITNLDEPVLDIFSERTFLNVDSRKQALTIRHLLKMRTGLQWNGEDVNYLNGTINSDDYALLTNLSDTNFDNWMPNPEFNSRQMVLSSDWVQFVLDKPMIADPGTTYYYHSGASHLLSAIIERKTGVNTEVFAKQYLFNPLGITDYLWFNDSMNISMGGFGLWLQPFDMTKIGYLFLNNGNWNGSQVVPSAWVEESTQDYSYPIGYGYQWWISGTHKYYLTRGLGGQIIIVKPDKDLVAVITASEYPDNNIWFTFDLYVLKAFIDTTTASSSTSTTTSSAQATSYSSMLLILGFVCLISTKRRRM
jgi:CubicO group peptidase (beta-lactamase class C family)